MGAAPLRAYPKNESIEFISRAACASWVTAVAGAGSDEVRGGGTIAAEEVEAADVADMIVVEVLSRWGAKSLKCRGRVEGSGGSGELHPAARGVI